MTPDIISEAAEKTPSKIVLLVADGLGGLPDPETGKSELETAHTPNLDGLAARSALGLTVPVRPGITPGSGPGHLALFGYDPEAYLIKRGIMEALGIGLDMGAGQIAARGNFCTVDSDGNLTDRRAGRIATELSTPLAARLDTIELDGCEVNVYPVRDYRFVAVFEGEGLEDDVSESDPQKLGVPPLPFHALSPGSAKTAAAATEFIDKARALLGGRDLANMAMLRGFSQFPTVPSMNELFRLDPVAIATYPMYRGLAQIVGMNVVDTGASFDDEIDTMTELWERHDYFFIHYKATDAAGEDGDFGKKVAAIEDLDRHLPRILDLKPDVLMIGGDHSTPSVIAAHSWHPSPFLLHSRYSGMEGVEGGGFSERACARGLLGRFPAKEALPLAMANAQKLAKFGA